MEELGTIERQPSSQNKVNISPEEFTAGKLRIAEKLHNSRQASYTIETVTKVSKTSRQELPFHQDTGRGMSWGRIIHKMLEVFAREETVDLNLMAENLLKEEQRPLSEIDEVVTTVKGVAASEMWKRMKTAEKAFVEVPFSLKIEDEKLPKVISGVIDLAFKESDGWVIVDYKTDKVDGNLDSLVDYYKSQIEMYRDFWKKMSGEIVKEAGIYFIDTKQWLIINN